MKSFVQRDHRLACAYGRSPSTPVTPRWQARSAESDAAGTISTDSSPATRKGAPEPVAPIVNIEFPKRGLFSIADPNAEVTPSIALIGNRTVTYIIGNSSRVGCGACMLLSDAFEGFLKVAAATWSTKADKVQPRILYVLRSQPTLLDFATHSYDADTRHACRYIQRLVKGLILPRKEAAGSLNSSGKQTGKSSSNVRKTSSASRPSIKGVKSRERLMLSQDQVGSFSKPCNLYPPRLNAGCCKQLPWQSVLIWLRQTPDVNTCQ